MAINYKTQRQNDYATEFLHFHFFFFLRPFPLIHVMECASVTRITVLIIITIESLLDLPMHNGP